MSNILLNNKYYNKLSVNKLSAISIKANDILPDKKSYLYSVLFQNNGTQYLTIDNNFAYLEFSNNDIKSIIEFTDRPFRQTTYISLEDLDNLFFMNNNDSFKNDPPNAVLVTEFGQKTFEIVSINVNNTQITYNLKILDSEENFAVDTISGQMSLFIDNETVSVSKTIVNYKIYNDDNDVLLIQKYFDVYVLLYYNTSSNIYLLDNNYGKWSFLYQNFINNYMDDSTIKLGSGLKYNNINNKNFNIDKNGNLLTITNKDDTITFNILDELSNQLFYYYVFDNSFTLSPNNNGYKITLSKSENQLIISNNENEELKRYIYKNNGAIHYLVILKNLNDPILYYDLDRKWNLYE